MHDQCAHQAGIAEAHFGFRRMHIGVDLARAERHEQRHHGMAVARQIVGIGGAHRAEDQLVAHGPAVDEEILPERIRPRQRRRGGKALDRHALPLGADVDRRAAEIGAENVAEACELAGSAR